MIVVVHDCNLENDSQFAVCARTAAIPHSHSIQQSPAAANVNHITHRPAFCHTKQHNMLCRGASLLSRLACAANLGQNPHRSISHALCSATAHCATG